MVRGAKIIVIVKLGVNLLQATNNKIQRLQNTLSMAKITKYCSNYERNTILKQIHMLVENTRNLLVLLISYQYDFQSMINQFFGGVYFFFPPFKYSDES